VIFGKFVMGKFLANKLGVTQESVEKVYSSLSLLLLPANMSRRLQANHASFMSFYHDWKPSELELCNKLADESYRDFVTK
jgi:hypothetical protein